MDKLILVHYIDVRMRRPSQPVGEFMNDIKSRFESNKEHMFYFVPVETESHVECINPKLVTGEEYKHAQEVLDRNQKIVDELVKTHKI